MTKGRRARIVLALNAEKSSDGKTLLVALLPSAVAAAWLISKAQWFWTTRPEMNFGWVVVLLCGFLFWEVWPTRPAPRFGSLAAPIALAIPGVALLFAFQIYYAAFGLMPASLAGLALGVMLMVFANFQWAFGWRGARHFAFPILFFLVALPWPTAIYNPIVSALQSLIVSIDVAILSLIGIPAQRMGNLIQLPSGMLGVDEACSGIRSLQSTIMATLFIGYLTLKNRTLQALLFCAGIALAVIGNIARSLYLSVKANSEGIEAVNVVHDAAGWSILAFTTVGVIAASWFLAKMDKQLLAATKRAEERRAQKNAPAGA